MNMTLGYPSIKSEAVRWNKATAQSYLGVALIGLLTGVLVTYGRTPLHLPGHKALWWVPSILAARLMSRRRLGAVVGTAGMIASTVLLGGRLAGGIAATPLVLAAGGILDLAAAGAELNQLKSPIATLLLILGGAAASLACFLQLLLRPDSLFSITHSGADLLAVAASYVAFGLLGGVLSCVFIIGWSRAAPGRR